MEGLIETFYDKERWFSGGSEVVSVVEKNEKIKEWNPASILWLGCCNTTIVTNMGPIKTQKL